MPRYVALLRAVNVGGAGKLKMDVLRDICGQAGFARVRTYIQSGNAVFDSALPASAAKAALAAPLAEHFGRPVDVIVRDAGEMRAVLARNPFPQAAPDKVAVLFLDEELPPDLDRPVKGQVDEEIVFGAREIFISYPSGMGRSRLRLAAMAGGTARNLNTVARLAAMATEDDP